MSLTRVQITPVLHVINPFLHNSDLPDFFKTGWVIILYKKGDCFIEGNYRQLSILPVIAKILDLIA